MEFTAFGIKIKIGFLFLWLVTILLCFNIGNELRLGILFSLLHETGHLTAIFFLKERPKEISFGLFGMTIKRRRDLSQNYRCEIITALAGPVTNFILALIFLILSRFIVNTIVLECVLVNIILGSFNIVPVFSLDGGRALEALLKLNFDNDISEKILKAVSFFALVIMMTGGIYILIISGYNFTLLAVSVYLTVLLFVRG